MRAARVALALGVATLITAGCGGFGGSSGPPSPDQGVWYHCGSGNLLPGQRAVYSGPMATYPVWNRPMAIYAERVERSYFVYGSAGNRPAISYYDHESDEFVWPTVIGTNPDGDAHRNPTLLIDDEGYIYVFWGAHGNSARVHRSTDPWEIDQWQERAVLEPSGGTSYPQPWMLDEGVIFVSYRKVPGWRYRVSFDGAQTWSAPTRLISFGEGHQAAGADEYAIYAITVAEDGPYPRRLHMAWSRLGGGSQQQMAGKALWARRYDVYYAYTDNAGATWHRSDGTEYELPIGEESAEKIYASGTDGVWLKDIQLDSAGNPYILFIDAQVETFESTWKVARRNGSGWAVSDVTRSDHMYDAGALLMTDGAIRVWGPSADLQPHADGGEIEEWVSADGGASWAQGSLLTSGSRFSHNYVRPVMGHQRGSGEVLAIWGYGDSRLPPATRKVELYYAGDGTSEGREIPFAPPPEEE